MLIHKRFYTLYTQTVIRWSDILHRKMIRGPFNLIAIIVFNMYQGHIPERLYIEGYCRFFVRILWAVSFGCIYRIIPKVSEERDNFNGWKGKGLWNDHGIDHFNILFLCESDPVSENGVYSYVSGGYDGSILRWSSGVIIQIFDRVSRPSVINELSQNTKMWGYIMLHNTDGFNVAGNIIVFPLLGFFGLQLLWSLSGLIFSLSESDNIKKQEQKDTEKQYVWNNDPNRQMRVVEW